MIKNIKTTDCGIEGEFEFKLFNLKTDVCADDDVEIGYMNKCIENLNSLSDEVIDKLCEYSIRYCEDYREYFEDEEIDIPEGIKGREILKYIYPVVVGIENPEVKNSIGYSIELNCDWEEEHGMEWVIRDNEVLYVSSYNGMGAWCDDYDDGGNYVKE